MQKPILFAFSLVLILLLSTPVSARYSAIVIDADNGEVIHETEAAQRWYPASLTKVMTLYMTFAALEAGKLHLDDMLSVSRHAAKQPKSKLGLRHGQQISVENAILAVATRSANDAAVTLAEHLGGSESHFAHLMTQQAHHMGMSSSSFVNASGLPNENQVSSARDLAILSLALIKHFPEYYRYFSTTEFHYKGQVLPNTNRILKSYPDADGLKTGFTCGSGYNLIASAKRNGHRLVGVLLGAHSSGERFEQMGNLLDVGFEKKATGVNNAHVSTLRDDDLAPPPFQLASNRCAGSAVQMGADAEAGDFEPIRIKANDHPQRLEPAVMHSQAKASVIFGSDYQKQHAEHQLQTARHTLVSLADKGHPRLIKYKIKGKTVWQTRWTGLDADEATEICRHLADTINDCRVLTASPPRPAGHRAVSHKQPARHQHHYRTVVHKKALHS